RWKLSVPFAAKQARWSSSLRPCPLEHANKLLLLLGGREPNQLLFGFSVPVQPAKHHGQGVVGGGVPRVLTDGPAQEYLRPVEPALGLVEFLQDLLSFRQTACTHEELPVVRRVLGAPVQSQRPTEGLVGCIGFAPAGAK